MKSILIALLLTCSLSAQTYTITDGRSTARGFNTDIGFITADHVLFQDAVIRFPDRDIRISSPKKTPPPADEPAAFKIGTGEPDYFIDRRGNRISITLQSTEELRWYTDQVFFPGESGTPVFNDTGEVVGLISGNRLGPDYGIVARCDNLKISAIELLSLLDIQGRDQRSIPLYHASSVASAIRVFQTEIENSSKDDIQPQSSPRILSPVPVRARLFRSRDK